MTEVSHEHFMDLALAEAAKALALDEVPVGAIVVGAAGDVIGRGHNCPISTKDPTGHAEIQALRHAARTAGNYRLTGATLYSTVEPCLMCGGAIVHARIGRLVYGAPDPKAGAAGSIYNVLVDPRLNHVVDIVRGVRDTESARLLQDFFKKRR